MDDRTFNSFNELVDAPPFGGARNSDFQDNDKIHVAGDITAFDAAVANMTQVTPKVVVPDGQLQAKLKQHWIGCRGREYETPHITIRAPNEDLARLLLRTQELMEPSKVDKDVIEAVKKDLRNNPNKYIDNWNENNPNHAIPLPQEKNELSKKDESWKNADWYREQQRISASIVKE